MGHAASRELPRDLGPAHPGEGNETNGAGYHDLPGSEHRELPPRGTRKVPPRGTDRFRRAAPGQVLPRGTGKGNQRHREREPALFRDSP
jgi:hypothetical protein